jgi:hypothetical protein
MERREIYGMIKSGQSVSLSSDGSNEAAGVSRNNGNDRDSGSVRIYLVLPVRVLTA